MPSHTGCWQSSGGCLDVASSKILVSFHSNSKATWGIHPKTCSVRLSVQHINLPNPPNPSANCNSFVPFSPLCGCPGTGRSGFTWSHTRSWLLTSGCVAPWRGLLSGTQAIGLHKGPLLNQLGMESSQEPPTPSAQQPWGSQPSQAHVLGRGMMQSQASLCSTGRCEGGSPAWLQRSVC